MKERILFIINPVSGIGKQKTVERTLERLLDVEKYNYSIAYTEYAHHATEIAHSAVEEGYTTIVAVGGDGSINDCVRGLIGTNARLGIIPAGSGNGLARCLHIPLDIERAIEVINNCNSINMDSVEVNGRVYASIAGVGFDALIAQQFTGNTVRGFQTYLRLVLQNYFAYKPKTYTLWIDGKIVQEEALFVSFANSNQFGYNAVIAPKASVNDGMLDVSIVKKIPLALGPLLIEMMFFRQLDKSTYVQTYSAKEVRLLDFEDGLINLDGEGIEMKDNELVFKVNPASLNIIIPDEKHKENFLSETKIAELIQEIKQKL